MAKQSAAAVVPPNIPETNSTSNTAAGTTVDTTVQPSDTPAMVSAAAASAGLFSRSGLFSNKALFILALTAVAGFAAYKYRKQIEAYFAKPCTEAKKPLNLIAASSGDDTEEMMRASKETEPAKTEAPADSSEEHPENDVNEASSKAAEPAQDKSPLTLEEFEHLTDEVDRDIGFDEEEQKAMDTAIARQRAQEAAAATYHLDETPGTITLIQTSNEEMMPLRGDSRIEEMTAEQLSIPGTEEHLLLQDDDASASGNTKRRRRR